MKQPIVSLKLLSVEERKFSIDKSFLANAAEDQQFNSGLLYSTDADIDQKMVRINLRVSISANGVDVLSEEGSFIFSVDNFDDFLIEEGQVNFGPLLPHLLNVAIGTLRGMMVIRAEGTSLAKCPMPLYNVMDVIKKSVKKEKED